ncbi:flavin-containing monooxygenase [Brachionus plicatilis]|uniref:Flavin-containing monooxygenase n=1 Tax=Brachionus plicatilis TaxID=10195 RepID=A0A3M7P820_BRAPC|nr:flavin-containing monooxygenase [Brachionus plicatilis]
MSGKKIAIIGAGKAGLVSAKYALENQLKPVVFEQTKQVGGLWSRNNGTAIWDGLFTNISKYTMMFHDFPWPKDSTVFNRAEDVQHYLKSYANQFKVFDHIKFDARVESVRKLLNNKWEVRTNSKSEVFDFLIFSPGLHSKPRIPFAKNSSKFKGLAIHSSEFRLNDPRLKDKRVLVLGCSLSGTEIASLLVGHAKTVTNIYPRTYLITPRLVKYKLSSDSTHGTLYKILPTDLFFNRRVFNYPDPKLGQNEVKQIKLDTFKRLFPYQTNKDSSHPDLYVDLDKPGQDILIAISDYYLAHVQKGKIKPIRSKIEEFEENSVKLENGLNVDCDAIVYCTGYDISNDILDESILETVKYDKTDHKYSLLLYKCTFHPDLKNFAMIGQTDGSFYTGDELQAYWANRVFNGKISLPSRDVMLNEIQKEEQKRNKNRRSQYPYGNYTVMVDKLAKECGLLPNFEAIKKQDEHLYELLWNSGVNSNSFFLEKNMSINIMNEIFEMNSREFVFEKNFDQITLEDMVAEYSKYYKLPKNLFKNK